jgi:putative phosphoribosyl transferase
MAFRRQFRDRRHAGALLAERLGHYAGKDALILGIPRGGVPVAAEVARRLNADLDVVVARKLPAPGAPELALGAVTANGGRYLNAHLIRNLRVSDAYLDAVIDEQMAEARRREGRLRGPYPVVPIQDCVVIVVDDGLATGATMQAAVRSVRTRRPAHLVVAVPVGSQDACTALRPEVDELVCLYTPEPFGAVGLYYQHFEPTDDAEVQQLLREARTRRTQPGVTAG